MPQDTPQLRLRGILNLINVCNARNAHAQIRDEKYVDSSTGDRSNYDFCNILSMPDQYDYKTLERICSNPIRGRNTVHGTNDLPMGATTIHARKRGLHPTREQRKHPLHQARPPLRAGSKLRWAVEEQSQHLPLPLPLLASELQTAIPKASFQTVTFSSCYLLSLFKSMHSISSQIYIMTDPTFSYSDPYLTKNHLSLSHWNPKHYSHTFAVLSLCFFVQLFLLALFC